MWNAWLGLDQSIQWDKEIIVSEAKERKEKNEENYNQLLCVAFSEIKRTLKPHRYFSMAFNCLDDETWIQTLNLFIEQGFELKDIVPLEYSATSVIQDNRKNALKTDFVLTFQNNDNRQLGEIKFKKDPEKLEDLIQTLHKKYPNYEVYNFMNALFEQTIPEGYIYRVSDIVNLCAEILG